jgi:2-methylisocitrate lyase-like PEP mutase family enzyme
MTQASRFRDLLSRDGMVVAPGAYDCITAKLIEQAGFAAVYMTGAGTAATLGYPDFGLVTMSEMVANAGRLVAAVDLPVIADADTGYGNELNMVRTVREFEGRGVVGIHIEDQDFPKNAAISKVKRSSRARTTWQRSAPRSPPAATRILSLSRAPTPAPSLDSTKR